MPTKQVNYRNDKAVLMKVYVEKSKKKRSSTSSLIQQHHHHHHHHHHYHIHHTVAQEVVDGSSCNSNKGYYDRRLRLLMYSRILRNSARGGASPLPLLPNYSQNNNIQIPTQMNSSKKKPKHAGASACFGNWKLLIPSFLRSWSNEQKKEKKKQRISGNGFKKLQVSKGKGFIPKFISIWKCA
ncbi:unnamed protein product [Trifolium pratense]|uniref:Uncharacterized protein n=1 Tax=Trifolium pratense TaxID=57577 RepID=A0ACB0L5S2_TRIPR|nr:unnamed protein product [Trifolium pratense]